MGVLDHEEQRALGAGRVEQRVDGVVQRAAVDRRVDGGVGGGLAPGEQPAAGAEPPERRVLLGDRVDEGRGVGGEAADHLGEREVGEGAVAEVEAVPGHDLPAFGEGEVAELGEEAGLADAGVAREEDGAHRVEAVDRTDAEQSGQGGQLVAAADERPSRWTSNRAEGHVHHCGGRYRLLPGSARAVLLPVGRGRGRRGRHQAARRARRALGRCGRKRWCAAFSGVYERRSSSRR